MSFGSNGKELIAPTMVEDSHKATIAPPAYTPTVVLFSTPSHFAFRSVYNSSNCLEASGVESSDDTALIGRGENLLVSVALHDREEAYALETVYFKSIVL